MADALTADAATRSTDTDALLSRLSAANLGYFNDPISPLLLSPSQRRQATPRPPLINIGTHARTWAIDQLVTQFLNSLPPATDGDAGGGGGQVLSLGAGTDGRFWRMKEEREKEGGGGWRCRKWVEVDFAEGTGAKARAVATKPRLKDALGGDAKILGGGTGLDSPLYAVLPCDLRDLPALTAALEPHLDPTLPTLLLAECVFVYVPPQDVSNLLSWFASTFSSGICVSYDPFGLDDSFGRVMVRNLAARGLSLPSAASTPTLDSLSQRLTASGFATAHTLSIAQIRAGVIPTEELQRVALIERIDEVEELNLVLDHYAVTWGSVQADEGAVGLATRE